MPVRIAAGLVALLFALVMLAAGACALAHTVSDSHHHEAASATPLSSICGWSCQAVSSGLALLAIALLWTWVVHRLRSDLPLRYALHAGTVFLPSRAPPVAA